MALTEMQHLSRRVQPKRAALVHQRHKLQQQRHTYMCTPWLPVNVVLGLVLSPIAVRLCADQNKIPRHPCPSKKRVFPPGTAANLGDCAVLHMLHGVRPFQCSKDPHSETGAAHVWLQQAAGARCAPPSSTPQYATTNTGHVNATTPNNLP